MSTTVVVVKKKQATNAVVDSTKPVSSYRAKQQGKYDSKKPGEASKKANFKAKKKAKPQAPRNIIYSSIELTASSDSEAKILQFNLVIPSTKPNSLEFKRESILCNNDGVEISADAQAYHGITAEMVADAPLAKDVSLPNYGYIALWDGFVGNILLNTNNVAIRKGSLIDLHKLLRFTKEHVSHRISLKKAALEATQDSLTPETVEGFLASSENKVLLLPVIMEYIRNLYKAKYGITDLGALARLSRQSCKKTFLETMKRVQENSSRKKSLQSKRSNKPTVRGQVSRNDSIKRFPRPTPIQPHTAQTIKAVA
ncbi:hypothetical protein MUB04_14700 [Acinetobacter indicus]|uniref:hypothetical protein n=1 Tax=Acinetobacter TaxID=469 RepID=UPI0015D14988|nr:MULTISPECIES: hypothetical protein [Acinetobacter]MCP0917782.1 hypothetical protein [Acinetobacter indicus]